MKEINLDIFEGDTFAESFLPYARGKMGEACAVVLERKPHACPVEIGVSGYFEDRLQISWQKLPHHGGYDDDQVRTEYAGLAMAVLVMFTCAKLVVIGAMKKGKGVDLKFKPLEPQTAPPNLDFMDDDALIYYCEAKGSDHKKYIQKQLDKGLNNCNKKHKDRPEAHEAYVISSEFETPAVLTAKYEHHGTTHA